MPWDSKRGKPTLSLAAVLITVTCSTVVRMCVCVSWVSDNFMKIRCRLLVRVEIVTKFV